MNQRVEHVHKQVALGLMALMLIAGLIINGMPPTSRPGGGNTLPSLNAAVQIKTLEAAEAVGGVKGIDVSKYQGSINWERVAGDDVKFVMARASIGTEVDETFVYNATAAHDNGIKVGAYHYAKFTDYNSMQREAQLFISQLRQVNITYPVALDIEAHRNLKRSELTRLCTAFVDEVKAAGYDVMIYSYYNFFRECLDINALSDYKLWVANYIEEPIMSQAIWQYTSYGSVAGISGRVDLNVAYDHWGVDYKRVIKVNSGISRSIKETLNKRYNAGLDLDSLDMELMGEAVAIGLQTEIVVQFKEDIAIYPYMTNLAMSYLESINYVKGKTNGNITYLIQVKLFYKGLYHEYPTGFYDDATAQAIYEYQLEQGLYADGSLNNETLNLLLMH